MATAYGIRPTDIDVFDTTFTEYACVQYMPVIIPESHLETGTITDKVCIAALPPQLCDAKEIVNAAIQYERGLGNDFSHVYITLKHGWATPGAPLNRPGLHTDGFGTEDINYVWVDGAPTDIYVQDFHDISDDDAISLQQFEAQADPASIIHAPNKTLQRLDPFVVHAAPAIDAAQLRSFVKVSFSNERYDLIGNAHNHTLHYNWPMHPRRIQRNLTASTS